MCITSHVASLFSSVQKQFFEVIDETHFSFWVIGFSAGDRPDFV